MCDNDIERWNNEKLFAEKRLQRPNAQSSYTGLFADWCSHTQSLSGIYSVAQWKVIQFWIVIKSH